ncbi:MAG: DUF1800 domain-containing protein [Chitinophagaceae bacterium]|nr:DUF1800 domain-containing protein [Chitinophagaceae bacterium]MBL0336687.1 DUF1800 domain-containing protein [Chitinophagaceae bacterium]
MDRREFFRKAGKAETVQARKATGARTNSGLNLYAGPWTKNEVQHLLKRTMFGSKLADINYFAGLTMGQAVDELLSPSAPMPSPPVNDYSPGTADPNVPAGSTWVNNFSTDGTINSVRRSSFKKWWTGVMINQDRSIREKLTLFWADHFGTETDTISYSQLIYNHHTLLRQNCLGNFKTLIKNVTIDAGMLRYLNGYLNTNSAPDENYARELQELFTLGKGPSVTYTEDDVKIAAKVLTGWRINNTNFSVYFDSTKHDTTTKQFSSYYGNASIPGQTGANGALETDALINMIFNKEEVSKYICRSLYRWFVYYEIDASAETNVIEPLAILFRNNNYDVKLILQTLFKSEHFFDVLNQGCIIKSPVDHVISCMREFGVIFPNTVSEYADAYGMWNYIRGWKASMNQDIGDPPNVSGWPAYYQEPQYHELWINSDTLPKRNQFTDIFITNGYTRNNKKIVINAVTFTQTLPNPADPNALIDDALSVLYRAPLSAASKQAIKEQILLSNQTQDYYWSNAWNAYIANPLDTASFNIVNNRLKSLYQYLMNLAEYQLS